MRISVTKDDIEQAKKVSSEFDRPRTCPIALALFREFQTICLVFDTHIFVPGVGEVVHTDESFAFVKAFDAGADVEPITLTWETNHANHPTIP